MTNLIYRVVEATEFNIAQIMRTDENGTVSAIPRDLGNADYQHYIASLSVTNKL